MTTTMRRKESKPTFDTLYIIPWLQATAIYTSKQSLIKNRVLKFALWRASLRVLLCPYIILTQVLSAFICGWKKMGRLGSVGETIFGVHSSFFVFMVLRLINHSSMIDQNKQCESPHSSFNRLKLNGQSLFVQQEKDHTLIECQAEGSLLQVLLIYYLLLTSVEPHPNIHFKSLSCAHKCCKYVRQWEETWGIMLHKGYWF